MNAWRRYLSRVWDLEREAHPEEEEETPAPAREQLPPGVQARMALAPRPARGQPLSARLRARLEASLGIDLAQVRIRHDPAAAQAVGARAFATGDQIVVGEVADLTDQRLVGHEAVHIVQAHRRGTEAGPGRTADGAESEATQVAEAIDRGQPANVSTGGRPVPALQRQPQQPARPAPANPLVRRETVRIMLLHQYQQQGASGPFKLTPVVRSELERLVPGLTTAHLELLWLPEPTGPLVVFQRLLDTGLLPSDSPVTEPQIVPSAPQPAARPKKEAAVSPMSMGMVGLHFRLNAQVSPPLSATIRQQLAGRGLPLRDQEMTSLLAGKRQGAQQIASLLATILPGLPGQDRTKLADTIAEALLDKSLSGQLQLEAPSRVEVLQEQEEMLAGLRGPLPSLLQRLPVGASVTIYF